VTPEELRYTSEHEWVARLTPDSVRVGITDYAQRQLGDVVFVSLPEAGARVDAGASIGEVESTKSVSEVYAPLAGEVVAINDAVADGPEVINTDPYGAGWLFELKIEDAGALDGLLTHTGYRELTESE
jgi:glycine cleavage system H protein